MMSEFCDIQELVKLFNPPREDEDSDCECTDTSERIMNEKTEEKSEQKKVNPYTRVETTKEEKKFTEECDTDVILSTESESVADWKKIPKWDITYRQKVTASDVFFQMGAKTPSTASCEDMIVTIDLPGEHMQNIDIKVLTERLEVNSPNFNLNIPLPHPVHPQNGNAKWDNEQEKLIITLRMEREFDFINF